MPLTILLIMADASTLLAFYGSVGGTLVYIQFTALSVLLCCCTTSNPIGVFLMRQFNGRL